MALDYYLSFVLSRKLVQKWCSLGTRMMLVLPAIKQQFAKLQEIGPHYGYYREPTKSILIVPQNNLAAATAAFKDSDFTITTGNRYLGGFIGENDSRDHWVTLK
jgi:hypothetical protein